MGGEEWFEKKRNCLGTLNPWEMRDYSTERMTRPLRKDNMLLFEDIVACYLRWTFSHAIIHPSSIAFLCFYWLRKHIKIRQMRMIKMRLAWQKLICSHGTEWTHSTNNRLIKTTNRRKRLAPLLNNPLITHSLYSCFYSQQPSLGHVPVCK